MRASLQLPSQPTVHQRPDKRVEKPSSLNRSLSQQGFCVMLTGLSGAGKSSLARALTREWESRYGERLTELDGDETRKLLSSELGFSKEHRELNVERLGFVASIAAAHGGGSIIAAIAPYESGRRKARELVEKEGGLFCVAHVSTPLGICEERDPKGLYKKARAGELIAFTGVSDPYEPPGEADMTLDMSAMSVDQGARELADWLGSRLANG